ncbi:hypothetical protein KBP53_10285 [Corynebacterium genitalium ATCC 33030]|uniref:Polyketide cyclase/dehydrase n=1 Tax=Corynebacterium genitalium ATCC 33030 TaxID=585529 RepID=D7W9N5_9CORY|nr:MULTISPECIES: hypothetical protein [Corynebacterium]EFK55515.1 hypothetical protein HMPREF0291_10773 [Corynebacterium genitalium ATCC 33030]MCQ4621584.1 hypothetical protein [Corynebacterium sp. CCUG 71335]MCQ4624994.1 hypothetical protein [Corynebacterium sp. CCUG 69979]MCQ4628016.1 hypothetical protein [Corynebacterium sp. CCUG 65737]UUA89254.1 hypothetical protein KBP53_10285 [Corynebacterium genitalium ATCC 33030]
MSFKTENSAAVTIHAGERAILGVVTDLERLPSWNPAFSFVSPPRADGSHALTVQKVLNGTIVAAASETSTGHVVDFEIDIPGLREHSSFLLESQLDGTTRVTHRIRQAGTLSAVIGQREAALVPGKRLARLARFLETES